MSNRLNVFLGNDLVGRLWLDEGRRFVFQYDATWLAAEAAIPLSLALPLQADAFGDDRARPFFANLLPESKLRRVIARKLGLSEQNDFALLEAVGGECAGAVSLLPDDNPPAGNGSYRTLDDDELDALIDELPRRPMLAGEQGIRLSLAGAQNKLPVRLDGEHVSLPMGVAPSSHILKPPIPQYPDSVYNEYFCMTLARRVGLAVPLARILRKRQDLYLVDRYDRRLMSDGALERVHQEDFCQALGVPPDQKYEKEGGPSLSDCFRVVREHSVMPVMDVRALLHWVVFNYLIGNADAHGKNISLLLTQAGPVLAPFYDLMCTTVYPDVTQRLAMGIGGEDRPDWVIARRWEQFAEDVGIQFKLVQRTLEDMKARVYGEAEALAAELHGEYPDIDVVDRVVDVIGARKRKVELAFAAVDQ